MVSLACRIPAVEVRVRRGLLVSRSAVCCLVKIPLVDQTLSLLIKGKAHVVTCTDVFDGGMGFYFDTVFPKRTRSKFAAGDQCGIPALGEDWRADFVSYSLTDAWKVRFFIPKWR